MGVPAAGGIGAGGHAGFLKVTPFFFADIKVIMIGGLLDQLVKVLVEMIAVHALIARAGHGMPEVANDGVDEKELAVFVPVVPPRIGGAVADDLERFAGGMIAPNPALDVGALGFGRAGAADLGAGAEDAVPAVQPAIGTPAQAVDDVVAHLVGVESIQNHLRLAIRLVVAVLVGQK